jgi:hypothetical protein
MRNGRRQQNIVILQFLELVGELQQQPFDHFRHRIDWIIDELLWGGHDCCVADSKQKVCYMLKWVI